MMARGELNLIGATTLNEYQKYIEKDAALERRQPVMVPEPTVAQTMMILRGLQTFEAHHKVNHRGRDHRRRRVVRPLHHRRFLPDKAIDLLDRAARCEAVGHGPPSGRTRAGVQLHQLRREQDYVASRKQYDKAAELGKHIGQRGRTQACREWERERASVAPKSKPSMSRRSSRA